MVSAHQHCKIYFPSNSIVRICVFFFSKQHTTEELPEFSSPNTTGHYNSCNNDTTKSKYPSPKPDNNSSILSRRAISLQQQRIRNRRPLPRRKRKRGLLNDDLSMYDNYNDYCHDIDGLNVPSLPQQPPPPRKRVRRLVPVIAWVNPRDGSVPVWQRVGDASKWYPDCAGAMNGIGAAGVTRRVRRKQRQQQQQHHQLQLRSQKQIQRQKDGQSQAYVQRQAQQPKSKSNVGRKRKTARPVNSVSSDEEDDDIENKERPPKRRRISLIGIDVSDDNNNAGGNEDDSKTLTNSKEHHPATSPSPSPSSSVKQIGRTSTAGGKATGQTSRRKRRGPVPGECTYLMQVMMERAMRRVEEYERRIQRIWKIENPDLINNWSQIVEKYGYQYHLLYERVCKKYGYVPLTEYDGQSIADETLVEQKIVRKKIKKKQNGNDLLTIGASNNTRNSQMTSPAQIQRHVSVNVVSGAASSISNISHNLKSLSNQTNNNNNNRKKNVSNGNINRQSTNGSNDPSRSEIMRTPNIVNVNAKPVVASFPPMTTFPLISLGYDKSDATNSNSNGNGNSNGSGTSTSTNVNGGGTSSKNSKNATFTFTPLTFDNIPNIGSKVQTNQSASTNTNNTNGSGGFTYSSNFSTGQGESNTATSNFGTTLNGGNNSSMGMVTLPIPQFGSMTNSSGGNLMNNGFNNSNNNNGNSRSGGFETGMNSMQFGSTMQNGNGPFGNNGSTNGSFGFGNNSNGQSGFGANIGFGFNSNNGGLQGFNNNNNNGFGNGGASGFHGNMFSGGGFGSNNMNGNNLNGNNGVNTNPGFHAQNRMNRKNRRVYRGKRRVTT